MANKAGKGFVVYGQEHLRDELVEWAKCFNTLEQAIEYINKDLFASNITFRLFRLGEEIPLVQENIEEPQPPKVKTKYKAAGGK